MTKVQGNRSKMFIAVLKLMNSNKPIWVKLIVISDLVTALSSLFQTITDQQANQPDDGTAETKDKNIVLELVKVAAYNGSLNLKALATKLGKIGMAKEATFTKKDFLKGSEPIVVTRCIFILNGLRSLEADPAAIGFGVTKLSNDALGALIDEVKPKEVAKTTAGVASVKVTSDMKAEYLQMTVLLKQMDSAMLANLAKTEPDFYKLYRLSRRQEKVTVVKKRKPVVKAIS